LPSLTFQLGDLSIRLQNYPEARMYLEESLALSKKTGYKRIIPNIYKHLAELDSAEGNYSLALEHYKCIPFMTTACLTRKATTRYPG